MQLFALQVEAKVPGENLCNHSDTISAQKASRFKRNIFLLRANSVRFINCIIFLLHIYS